MSVKITYYLEVIILVVLLGRTGMGGIEKTVCRQS